MKPKKIIPTVEVTYLKDAAGIIAGTVKVLPESLAADMVAKGVVSINGQAPAEVTAAPKKAAPKKKK